MHAQVALWFARKRKVYKSHQERNLACFLQPHLFSHWWSSPSFSIHNFLSSFPKIFFPFWCIWFCCYGERTKGKKKLRSILKIALAFWMIACIEEVLMDWIDFEEKNHPIQSFWLCWFIIDNECRIVPKTNKTSNLQCRINLDRTQKYDSIWFLYSFTYKQKGEDFME